MYKNTVSKCQAKKSTLSRVRNGESDDELKTRAQELAQLGVVEFVFPTQELLDCWRQRVAALA